VTAAPETIFDTSQYLKLIEARGETIRRVVSQLKPVLKLSTALDTGCGVGFFSEILRECGLQVRAFDGRQNNVNEARRRFPQIPFELGNIEAGDIRDLGQFDLVLCFGLLYHLESPLPAIRNLRSLTGKGLLIESMCFPDQEPWMLLREEPSTEDQSLTDIAFYPTEGCLAKMLYRAGFQVVYRITQLPDHDDFRNNFDHFRRRTVLFASSQPVELQGLIALPEPSHASDPWQKPYAISVPVHRRIVRFLNISQRMRSFASRPTADKIRSVATRLRRIFPNAPIPHRLHFGAWFLVGNSQVDRALFSGDFESSEIHFVQKYLQPGMTVLDVGAHHGLYTLLSSKLVGPSGRVISFEPSPRERKQLVRNVRINFCSNVMIEPYALGKEPARNNLYVVEGAEDGCNSLRPPVVVSRTSTVRVDVVTLDQIVPKLRVTKVDFIKLDVEGAELDVLKGALGLLQTAPRPVLLVEVYDIRTQPWGYEAREIVQFLDEQGYRWFKLLRSGSIQPIAPNLPVYDANLVAVPEERADLALQNAELTNNV
jgi:FkbM family methyltransferase